jgi:hypothetical protein
LRPPSGLFIITGVVFLFGIAAHMVERFIASRPRYAASGKVDPDVSDGMNESQMLVRVLHHLESMQKSTSEAALKTLVAASVSAALREHKGWLTKDLDAVRPVGAKDK